MKKSIFITLISLFLVFISNAFVLAEKVPTPEQIQKIEEKSPLGQTIKTHYNLEEPLVHLKAEVKELRKLIKILQGKTDISNHQLNSRIELIEETVIYFDNDSSRLQLAGEKEIEKLHPLITDLNFLIKSPAKFNIIIEAKADGVGTDMHNFNLAIKRGIEIKNAFIEAGFPEFMFKVVPFGEYRFQGKIEDKPNPDERVVTFSVVLGEEISNQYEEMLLRLSILNNTIRNMELLIMLEKHEVEWPYKGHPNPYHKK